MGYNGTRRKSSMCITPSLYLATCSISQFQEKSVFTIVGWCLISIRMNYAAMLPPLFRSTIVCSWAQRVWNRVMLSLMSCSKHGALPGGWRTDTLNAEYSLCCRPMGAPGGGTSKLLQLKPGRKNELSCCCENDGCTQRLCTTYSPMIPHTKKRAKCNRPEQCLEQMVM